MTEDEMDMLAGKIADAIEDRRQNRGIVRLSVQQSTYEGTDPERMRVLRDWLRNGQVGPRPQSGDAA